MYTATLQVSVVVSMASRVGNGQAVLVIAIGQGPTNRCYFVRRQSNVYPEVELPAQ